MTEINITQKNSTQEVINMENPSIPQSDADMQRENQELLRIKTGYNQHASLLETIFTSMVFLF